MKPFHADRMDAPLRHAASNTDFVVLDEDRIVGRVMQFDDGLSSPEVEDRHKAHPPRGSDGQPDFNLAATGRSRRCNPEQRLRAFDRRVRPNLDERLTDDCGLARSLISRLHEPRPQGDSDKPITGLN